MKSAPTLNTNRCVLSAITLNDIPMLRQILDDTETKRFLPELCEAFQTEKSLRQLITSFDKYLIQNKGVLWGIRKDDNLIGFIAIIDIPTNSTLFYAMHPLYRNYGYTKEAVSKVARSFKEKHPKLSMHTEVYNDNYASISILQSCGFKVSGKANKKNMLTLVPLPFATFQL